MAKLSTQEVKNFKTMMHKLKEAFVKKRAEAQGSRERMKTLADRCVQAYNEAEKRKALGRPGINPKMAAKKKKNTVPAEPEASRQEAVPLVFPTATTGSSQQLQSSRRQELLRLKPGRGNTLKPLLLPPPRKRERPRKLGLLP